MESEEGQEEERSREEVRWFQHHGQRRRSQRATAAGKPRDWITSRHLEVLKLHTFLTLSGAMERWMMSERTTGSRISYSFCSTYVSDGENAAK